MNMQVDEVGSRTLAGLFAPGHTSSRTQSVVGSQQSIARPPTTDQWLLATPTVHLTEKGPRDRLSGSLFHVSILCQQRQRPAPLRRERA